MAPRDPTDPSDSEAIPFGAMELPPGYQHRPEPRPAREAAPNPQPAPARSSEPRPRDPGETRTQEPPHAREARSQEPLEREALERDERSKDWRRPENRRGSGRRGGRRRFRPNDEGGEGRENGVPAPLAPAHQAAAEPGLDEPHAELGAPDSAPHPLAGPGQRPHGREGFGGDEHGRGGRRRRRRRGGGWQPQGQPQPAESGVAVEGEPRHPQPGYRPQQPQGQPPQPRQVDAVGMFVSEKGGIGFLRSQDNQFMPTRHDVFVPPHLVARHKLRDGALVEGPARPGAGPHKLALQAVLKVDGKDPRELEHLVAFKKLTSIDPDFHYAVGDSSRDVSMRIIDLICPIGRGTRGLIVAPPRSGKTILMRKFAAAIESTYPDVILMVLLVDERPEEATEWRRSTKGQVFVSTNDESAKHHVELAEGVWMRCQRLVELGHDVVLLLDSITRLARAYNNMEGGSGRTLSGGLDTRAMERPKGLFGSARNTETAGSLTILGTTLVETGSRLDQVVFEEFKGTGNSELVLSRKLADRRIFPAIDIERSGTRKEEKLISARRLKQIHTLRRVLLKMNFIEAMELLITKLEDVEKTDDFLKRFEVDPEA